MCTPEMWSCIIKYEQSSNRSLVSSGKKTEQQMEWKILLFCIEFWVKSFYLQLSLEARWHLYTTHLINSFFREIFSFLLLHSLDATTLQEVAVSDVERVALLDNFYKKILCSRNTEISFISKRSKHQLHVLTINRPPFTFKHLIHVQIPEQAKEEEKTAKGYKSTRKINLQFPISLLDKKDLFL